MSTHWCSGYTGDCGCLQSPPWLLGAPEPQPWQPHLSFTNAPQQERMLGRMEEENAPFCRSATQKVSLLKFCSQLSLPLVWKSDLVWSARTHPTGFHP